MSGDPAPVWVVCRRPLFERLARAAEGSVHVDPLRLESEPALSALCRLDEVCFGDRGLSSPRWMRFDCSYLPGLVLAITAPAKLALPALREALWPGAPDPDPLPIAFAAVVPMRGEGVWLVNPCGTADARLAPLPSLLRLVMGLVRPVRLAAIAAWGSPELAAWTSFAPLRLRAAWTPFRGRAASCVVEHHPEMGGARPRALDLRGGQAERLPMTEASLRGVQRDLESGARAWLLGVGGVEPGAPWVEILWEEPR